MYSVQKIKEQGLCVGCGICAAVCPEGAVCMQTERTGRSEATVSKRCVSCSICLQCCPQSQFSYEEFDGYCADFPNEGSYIRCRLAHSRNAELLSGGTSGGFVTTMIQALLTNGDYQAVFAVAEHRFAKAVQTRRIEQGDLRNTQKSRYVQIAHTDEIDYILKHRDERLILIGTPCYLHGFLKVVQKYRLKRENYLLIGLFCDKTMTAHVWEYFDCVFSNGQLDALHFRDKSEGGWPGDVRLFMKDGREQSLSRTERMDIKQYFMPESCLYCLDKLNMFADFSVGDNYVDGRPGQAGSNIVISRTARAELLWNRYQELFVYQDCSMEQVAHSQHLEGRRANAIYRELKGLESPMRFRVKISKTEAERQYQDIMRKIRMGESGDYENIRKEVLERRKKSKSPMWRLRSRIGGMVKSWRNRISIK